MKCPKNEDGIHRVSYPKKIGEKIIEDAGWFRIVQVRYDRPFKGPDQFCMDCGTAVW